jgi:hypothetical protein
LVHRRGDGGRAPSLEDCDFALFGNVWDHWLDDFRAYCVQSEMGRLGDEGAECVIEYCRIARLVGVVEVADAEELGRHEGCVGAAEDSEATRGVGCDNRLAV